MSKNKKVKVLIITGYGLNCERETALAFKMVGAEPQLVHLNDILSGLSSLYTYHILAIIGGFSYGDHLGAGIAFANKLRYKLGKELEKFLKDGKLIIGICNGFQIIARLGLIPAINGELFVPKVALALNRQGVFRDAWVSLRAEPLSPCVFTRGIDTIELPIRHGEGRFITKDEATLQQIEQMRLVALRYIDPTTGNPTDQFPYNPNGSVNAIAGICDPSGRVFGLMPHPEAYILPYHHPMWRRHLLRGTLPPEGCGLRIFRNGVEFAREYLV